jgi:hypothetical protein
MPGPTTVVSRAEVAWVPVGAEVVVRVPATGALHVLDPAGALLWQCLDGESSLQLVFADLADAFQVAPEVIAADCLPAVRSWLQAGIAVVSSARPAQRPPVLQTWRRLVDPPNT